MLWLMWTASVYSGFGLSAFPRQEWLLETLISIVFLIPVINFLTCRGDFLLGVRIIGVMLLLHSGWDALHWTSLDIVRTPIDPRIPQLCPLFDIPLGILLLLRSK